MRLIVPALVFALMTSCSLAPLSPGCQNLNDPFYDNYYLAGNVFFSPFSAGERVSVVLDAPDAATTLMLVVTDTSGGTRRDLVEAQAPSGQGLSYVFTRDRADAEVYWSADAGVPGWQVSCSR